MEGFKQDQIDKIDRLLRRRLSARSKQPLSCNGFDPDLATAYVEKALSPSEQQSYQLHLSECHKCRKLFSEFALFISETDTEAPIKEEAREQSRFSFETLRLWIFGPQLRWVLPAALIFFVAGAIWLVTDKQPYPVAE